jgi:SagB-type dehydrogenase family enzyme
VSRRALLRRSRHLLAYWHGERLIFHNYATGVRISADPMTVVVLHVFDRWRSVDTLALRFPEFSRSSLRAAVANLERHTLLDRREGPADKSAAALTRWGLWNPAAGFFHLSTKDVAFSREPRGLHWPPMPSTTKRYSGAPRYPLPPVTDTGQFVDVLRARRTWRHFSRRPVKIDQMATLLALTFGVQNWLLLPGLGRSPLKTSPSGGARHPIEAYLLARHIDGLAPGLYHYVADQHQLELLRAHRRPVTYYLPTQTWFNGAAAVILMTAVFPRVQWRYKFARAYRVVLAESGHFCQTFCLTATWLGLAPFCSMALADSRIERDLGIDGVTESVLYAAGVGTRPTRKDTTVPRSAAAPASSASRPRRRGR